jgi:hypothetical protein
MRELLLSAVGDGGGDGSSLEMSMTSDSSEKDELGGHGEFCSTRAGRVTEDEDLGSGAGRETNARDVFLVYKKRTESV